MSKKTVRLGKGLSALLGDVSSVPNTTEPSSPFEVPLNAVEVNPFQPRKYFDKEALEGLAHSIKMHGIIQPITVRRLAENKYQLIAGERRYHAAQLAGLEVVPAHIRLADDQQMLEMALVENIQRENLNPIEVALSYQRLITEINLKQDELGSRVGKKRATVTNYLRLLKLPPSIQVALRNREITMGHARALVNAGSVDTQLHIFEKITEKGLSVRQTEELTRELMATSHPTPPALKKDKPTESLQDQEIKHLQAQLSSHFGTKVEVKRNGRRGDIKIPFLSTEDLNRILNILNL